MFTEKSQVKDFRFEFKNFTGGMVFYNFFMESTLLNCFQTQLLDVKMGFNYNGFVIFGVEPQTWSTAGGHNINQAQLKWLIVFGLALWLFLI